MTIYDFDDNPIEVELPDKEIEKILVCVFSGDEIGIVEFTDGSILKFDASGSRVTDHFDGTYTVKKNDIEEWMNFEMPEKKMLSYIRMEHFKKRKGALIMKDVNELCICRDRYNSEKEFKDAILSAVCLLLNAGYTMKIRYDDAGLQIIVIEYVYDACLNYGGPQLVWLSEEDQEKLETLKNSEL